MACSVAPIPTPIYRIIHVDNLHIYLRRQRMHAPNHTPTDGLVYRTIHDEDVQLSRRATCVPCGRRGTVRDYVPFYFGPRSPMLYRLHTSYRVRYAEGQRPLLYLVATAQAVADAGRPFVFSDGHGLAAFTSWFDDLRKLDRLDWPTIYAEWWRDTPDDMDRQRRKQAEFLVHHWCPWPVVHEIAVLNEEAKQRVEDILAQYPPACRPLVAVRPSWYY